MPIKCCRGCLPPKRNSYCHISCPEYKKESEEHQAQMQAEYESKCIMGNTYDMRRKAYDRFLRRSKWKRGR